MSGEEALGYKPSKYQEKIFDFIVHGNGNCVISACAGSGKTSTCIASLKLIDKKRKCLFLAFNKSIASEISNKLNGVENVDVRTSHSLGLAIIKDNIDNHIEIDEYKYRTYIKSNIIELSEDDELKETKKRKLTSIIDNVSQLVDLSRLNMCQTSKEIRCIADKYGIPILFDEDKIVEKVLYWGLSVLDRIDYTDMLWFPIELSMNTSKFKKDFIFIDECQDQSLLSIELFLKCFKRGSRFISVGDENQAINQFCGASEEAFKFMCDYKNTVVFELPVCHRCPRKVIALAKDFTTNIIERDGVDEGNIIYGNSLLNVQEGDMVLCRTKSPLLLAYTMLISNGIKCYIAGREYEQKLKKTISKIKEEQLNKDLKDVGLFAMLYDELFNERNNIMRKTGLDYRDATLSPYIRDIYDIIKSLEVISNDITTKEELMSRLEEVFKEDVDSVVLSTIHKSKGLEANNVHILCKSSMPMKSAKKDWEIASEENLIYVAYTRAKKTLTFISENEIKPFGAIDNPDAILEELELIENVVCKLLDKEPINQADKVQLSRFNISSGLTKIDLNIIDENKVELGSVKNFNNIDDSDLLSELEELM